MAREAVLRDNKILTSRRYSCVSFANIPKGSYLYLSGDLQASLATTTGQIFVGFAHAEKDPTDYSTSITADKGGIYELYASGAITKGCFVKIATPGNYVMQATAADMTSYSQLALGVALEDATANEVINVEVFP